jgi:threonylcarbamoyladenosine tRNA methylthiotransferase MtaB
VTGSPFRRDEDPVAASSTAHGVRVFFSNLGCKLNQAEVDALARQFAARGHRVVGSLTEADLHVVNSCTVTHQAARDSRKAARRGARQGHPLRTVLTGCYATASAAEAAALAGVDLVVHNRDKDRLVDLVARELPRWAAAERAAGAGDAPPARPTVEHRTRRERASSTPPARTASDLPAAGAVASVAAVPGSRLALELGPARALVKIEDGCDMRCAFCIIPRTRGGQRSRPLVEVTREAAALEAAGHREIVITGVQISAYRDGAARLPELLDALLAATGACRFRLTSIAPWELDAPLLERLDHPRICRHVHLSLQSGDDRTLRRMRRPYSAARFAAVLDALRERAPGCAVTTDVIAGFPGETDEEFEASLAFVAAARFAKVHVFTFSARPGTEAAGLPDPVPAERRRERTGRLLGVAAAAEEAFRRAHLGSVARVLWEGERDGAWIGTSDNYLRIFARGAVGGLRGHLTSATLVELVPGGLGAMLAAAPSS